MLPAELLRQIRMLEIRTNRAVDELIGGAYHSVFKGRGIEFDEVREYTPDDDVRDIDWNVTARMSVPYIKKYVEERELNVMLAVDVSASGTFGSGDKNKRTAAAELAALLAFSAGSNGDKVGLLLFSDRRELLLPPRSGRKHTLRLIRELLAFQEKGKGTDIVHALEDMERFLSKRSVIFLISDFLDGGDYEKPLKILNKRHDVIAVRLRDKAELDWELPAGVCIQDAETGELWEFDGSKRSRELFREAAKQELAAGNALCQRAGVDLIDIASGEDPIRPLIGFFNRRRRHLRGI
ncbi:MAG: DUF58 domain-containing protein [Lentisphaeria bacterium]|nr:DUF58 domain-containing protein [Lentisphaeria bacterium]